MSSLELDYQDLLKRHRKKLLFDAEEIQFQTPTEGLDREALQRILPHREPFLLIDRLEGIDIEEGTILGKKFLEPKLPLFKGHFPDYPVYPGSLGVEAIGQLGLCLYYFIQNNTTSPPAPGTLAPPLSIRATRIIGAYFLHPMLPGKELTILSKRIEYDGFFATALGQIISEGKICCVSAGEVLFLD